MKLQTIAAPTMAEAIARVKAELGTTAVILHTRTITHRKWLGMRKQTRVEITVGQNLPRRRPTPPPAAPVKRTVAPTPALPSQMPPAMHAEVLAALAAKNKQQDTTQSAAQNAALSAINKEVGDLKSMMKDLVKLHQQGMKPDLPAPLFDAYLKLVEAEVREDLANQIVAGVREVATQGDSDLDADEVRQRMICEAIAAQVPTGGAIRHHGQDRPHVIALIGPTGVGKTTTVAKLAANLQLVQGKRVGLLTIDTYRIAAVDQLRKFSDIIEARLQVAHTAEEIPDALQRLSDCEFVLLDTAGRSPKDDLHLRELEHCLKIAQPDEVHLVMSANQGRSSAEMSAERFGRVKPDRVIFTKLDEAAQVGVVLNVMQKLGRPISYVTFGQNVPNDIEVACGRRLAQAILGEDLTSNPLPMPGPDDDPPTGQRAQRRTRIDAEASAPVRKESSLADARGEAA